MGWSGEGRVKWGGTKLPSLLIGQQGRLHFQWPMELRPWFLNVEDKLVHPKQRWQLVGEKFGFDLRAERKYHGSVGILSTEAQARVWHKCEIKAVSTWGLSAKKGYGCCKKPNMGKISTQLGRAILCYLGSRHRCVFLGRLRWKCYTTSLEC